MMKSNFEYNNENGLVLCGYHKKLKTMKKKFFVLFKDTIQNVARLEYYDNEKKFRSGFNAKKAIKLKNCFNINRRLDTKYDFVIALSTKEGALGIVIEAEDEMNKWLSTLLSLQRRVVNEWDLPPFDHVWQVNIQKKSLAEHKWLFGNYHVCLANKSVTFIKITTDKNILTDQRLPTAEVLLTTIRRCGDSQCIFYMEIGRQSILGPGEIWMETEDSIIAQHMHKMILSKMTSRNELPDEPMRKRSSSATEASKPLNERRTINSCTTANNSLPNAATYIRERCDSLPSRNRSSSECSSNHILKNNPSLTTYRSHMNPRLSISPPIMCSESEESSISIDDSDESFMFMPYRLSTRASDEVIPEESAEEPSYSDTNIKIQQDVKTNDNARSVNSDTGKYSSKITGNLSNQAECSSGTFSKFLSESKESFADTELNGMRPVRAYSVGNKVQHSHVQSLKEKQSNDNSSNRVRAFSVGSRAKISKCDAIRTHKLNLNNNNNGSVHYMMDIMSNKKSISAPLLINKYQNTSAERMSDLMEIDFTKQTERKYCNNKLPPSKEIKTSNDVKLTTDNRNEDSLKDLMVIGVSQTDNGYLEMKPIAIKSTTMKNGLLCGNSGGGGVNNGVNVRGTMLNASSNNTNMNNYNSPDINSIHYGTCLTLSSSSSNKNKSNDVTTKFTGSSEIVKTLNKTSLDKSTLTLMTTATPTLITATENVNLIKPDLDYCMNEKLISIEGDTTNGKYKEKHDTIIQNITSRLIHLKNINEIDNLDVTQNNEFSFNNIINHHSNADCAEILHATTTAITTATSTKTTLDISRLKSNISTIKTLSALPPPPIHSLYYASLDLPMCGNRDSFPLSNKVHNSHVAVTNDTPPSLLMIKNSYAKIDFDHHD